MNRKKTAARSAVVMTALGTALALTAGPSLAAGSGQQVSTVSAADRSAALAYWTPERMRAMGQQDGLPPAETVGQLWKGAVPAGVGRLFFQAQPGGYDESCTATVVPSPSKDVALTAGHCLDGGTDSQDQPIKYVNMVFVPGYDHGKQPHGMFPVRAFAWSDSYQGPSSSTDDDGMIAVDPVAGKHVADAAGTQNISFDKPKAPVNTTMLGYPVSQLGRGEALESCSKPASLESNSVYTGWKTPCDLAGGSSGGPWMRDFDASTGRGTIYAVTSKGTVNADGTTKDLNAALLTDAVRDLYQRAGTL